MSTDDQQVAIDRDALAADVVERLDPGTVIDDKIIVSRRQLLAVAGSGLGAGALAALGVDDAEAQSAAGQVGTEADPNDAYTVNNYSVQQSSTPSAPPSGYVGLYAKDDGNMYKQTPDGTEAGLGLQSGADFDGAGTSDFTNLNSVDTERLGNAHVYASGYGTDGAAIQSALNEHGANPCTVHVDVSVSTLSSAAPLEVPSNTLVAVEGDITLGDSVNENIFQNTNFEDDATDDSNIHFEFAGGELDVNKANQSGNTSGSRASGFYVNAISFAGCQNVSVREPVITDAYNHGIVFAGVDNGQVTGGKITNSRVSGIMPHWRESDQRINTNIRLRDITIAGSSQTYGAFVSGSDDVALSGWNVSDAGEACIKVVDGDDGLGSNEVRISDSYLADSSGSTDAGVKIETIQVVSDGTAIQNVSVENCHIDVAGLGVYTVPTENNIIDVLVNDCRIAADQPIRFLDDTNDTIEPVVSDCTLAASGDYGVRMSASSPKILDNDVNGASTYGIYGMSGNSDALVIHNDLRGTPGHSLNGSSPITDPVGQGTAEDYNIT